MQSNTTSGGFSPENPWVAIQRNPRSGAGPRRAELLELIAHLKRLGVRPRLYSRRERLAERMDVEAGRENLLGVVAAGGDGTIADLFNRFAGLPVAVLPLGTENLLARHLGIPRSGRFVAGMIAAGETKRLDLCAIRSSIPQTACPSTGPAGQTGNSLQRRFLIMASAGFDAEVIHRTHAGRQGHIRRLSYVRPIWQALRQYHHAGLRLFLDGDAEPLAGGMAVVANLPMYALKLPIARSARGDDGILDVRVFQRGSAFHLLRYFCNVCLRRHERLADVSVAAARTVRVESERPVPVQIDGDPAGFTPAEIKVLPAALEVFVPRPEK